MILFSEKWAVVPTRAIEIYCPWTVALCLDDTVWNVRWIAIGGHCVVMVPWSGTAKRNENDEQNNAIS